jgi:hypothetical protein
MMSERRGGELVWWFKPGLHCDLVVRYGYADSARKPVLDGVRLVECGPDADRRMS